MCVDSTIQYASTGYPEKANGATKGRLAYYQVVIMMILSHICDTTHDQFHPPVLYYSMTCFLSGCVPGGVSPTTEVDACTTILLLMSHASFID